MESFSPGDVYADAEECVTLWGPRYWGYLRRRDDGATVWRSPICMSLNKAQECAARALFGGFDVVHREFADSRRQRR